jgi:glycosyltransferase involved in cell wall biosynthesis
LGGRARAVEGLVVSAERYPLISVLIPNYNYLKYVATAVESVLAQTYPNIEVVVSDNCSTDGAWELLNARFGTDARVRLHRNERNIGMARNFDRLLELARGQFLMCLSSDDFLLPDHLARLEDVFRRRPDLDVVYCKAYFAREDGTIYSMRAMPGEFPVDFVDARDELVEEFTSVCPICFPCALFKREVLLEPGICGDPGNGQDARDWEVMIRLALANKRFGYIAEPGMAIRLHADQFSGDAYHRSGRNVLDFASYVERYIDHPEFVRRMRGRETGVARVLGGLVAQAPSFSGGISPFDAGQLARFGELEARLRERAAVYDPAPASSARVSVVIDASGPPQPLLRALDSLVAQRHLDWEAVVVDRGPIPVEALLRAHPAWKQTSYVRMPAATTPGAARNLGLRMARGEYVAFLDPDNRFTPDHLSSALAEVVRTGALVTLASSRLSLERSDGAASSFELLDEQTTFVPDESDVARLNVAHALPLDALVLYRGVFDHVGNFNDSVPFLEDWDFTLRLTRAATFAPTAAATLVVTARVALAGQRLAGALPHYLAVMDALYAAHPADARVAERRALHRETVAGALASAPDWVREPHGLAAFMDALAGRHAASELGATQPA